MPSDAPHEQMARMINGYWISRMVHAVASLGLADRVADGPKALEELARETGTHARSLYRLLRALAGLGVFSEDDAGRFRSTPLSDCLRRGAPGSQWAMAMMMGEEHLRCWDDLIATVRTGETAFDRLYGQPIFEWLADRPEQAAVFDAAMTAIHGRETQSTLAAYDFSGIGVLADVGGGNASNLIATLKHYPNMRGILFDLPHVAGRARPNIEAAGLAGRCEVVTGNFFEGVPVEAGAYFLRHIIHDWDDDKAAAILGNVRRSMPAGAKVLVVEHVLPPGDEPSFGKLQDLNMMLLPGGAERTAAEFEALYDRAGLRLARIVPVDEDLSVIEGVAK